MIPHPEGGFFAEVYRAGSLPYISKGKTDLNGRLIDTPEGKRNEMTSIYWMSNLDAPILNMGCNLSPHIHYYNGGDPFRYILIKPDGEIQEIVMGPDPTKGHQA